MSIDDERVQTANSQMRELYTARTTLDAARAYDELSCHTIPAIEAEDPKLAEDCRRAVSRILKERVRRRYALM